MNYEFANCCRVLPEVSTPWALERVTNHYQRDESNEDWVDSFEVEPAVSRSFHLQLVAMNGRTCSLRYCGISGFREDHSITVYRGPIVPTERLRPPLGSSDDAESRV